MLSHTCPVCRAKMDLDTIIRSAVEDAEARRLIEFLVLHHQPTVGAAVMRYLRLFTPPKNRLSWRRARTVIGEIVEAIKAHKITRNGREWRVSVADFEDAFQSVFTAVDKGTVELPLTSNSYLWEVLRSRTNRAEAREEQQHIEQLRTGPREGHTTGPQAIGAVLPTAPVHVEGRAAKQMREERERALERRQRLLERTAEQAAQEGGASD